MDKRPGQRIDQPVPGAVPYSYHAAAGSTLPEWGLGPGAASGYPPHQQDGFEAGAVSALTFLAGVWLVLAPLALDYPAAGAAFDGSWNDVVIGSAIAVVALVRIALPVRIAALGLVNVGLGAWLLVAPTVLSYTSVPGASSATWNDIIVGIIVMALASFSALVGLSRDRHTRSAAGSAARLP